MAKAVDSRNRLFDGLFPLLNTLMDLGLMPPPSEEVYALCDDHVNRVLNERV